jgi:hypothetical protein
VHLAFPTVFEPIKGAALSATGKTGRLCLLTLPARMS